MPIGEFTHRMLPVYEERFSHRPPDRFRIGRVWPNGIQLELRRPGPTPYFTGVVNGLAPFAHATLQSSTSLGIGDLWLDLITVQANASGSFSFLDVPDPFAAGYPRNFYRVVTP